MSAVWGHPRAGEGVVLVLKTELEHTTDHFYNLLIIIKGSAPSSGKDLNLQRLLKQYLDF